MQYTVEINFCIKLNILKKFGESDCCRKTTELLARRQGTTAFFAFSTYESASLVSIFKQY